MCGMQAEEEGKPCSNIFECDPLLSCDKPVEADIYRASRPFMMAADFSRDISMCCICAGTSDDAEGGKVDAELMKSIYSVVLPICGMCKSQGAKVVVGYYLLNDQAILKRLNKDRQKAVATPRV